MRGLIRDSVVELFDRKVIYVFGVVTLIAVAIIGLLRSAEVRFEGQIGMDADSVTEMFSDQLLSGQNQFMSILVFLAVMAAAGLIPNMLIKGRADFYLSKPLSRSALLLRKLTSIWIVYGGMVVLCGLVDVLAFALINSFFSWGVLWIFLFKMLGLLIWLSIVVFAGVLSGSTSVSIMSAFFVYVLQWLLEWREIMIEFLDSQAVTFSLNLVYYILPKNDELSDITMRLVQQQAIHSWMPLWSSVLFAFSLVYITVLVFKHRDY